MPATLEAAPARKNRPISARKRLANRLNAQKSTGPKTAEGKARSRRNALKHGLAGAGIVTHTDDQDPLNQRLTDWTADLEPTSSVESWLIGRAALASVRLDRAARMEAATLIERRQGALATWDYKQRLQVESAVARLPRDPAGSIQALQATAAGCDWLIGRWRELQGLSLEDPRSLETWTTRALGLLGLQAIPPLSAPEPYASFGLCLLAARTAWDLDAIDRHLGTSTRRLDPAARLADARSKLPDPEAARSALRIVMEDEIANLSARRAAIWNETDGPSRQRAEDQALADLSTTGNLLRRYESAHSLEVHRCLNQLAKLRREAAREAAEALPPPARILVAAPARRRPTIPMRKKPTRPALRRPPRNRKAICGRPRPLPPRRPGADRSIIPRPLAKRLRPTLLKEATTPRTPIGTSAPGRTSATETPHPRLAPSHPSPRIETEPPAVEARPDPA